MSGASAVRTAVPADEAGIMSLCRLLHEENGPFPLDEAKVSFMLRRAWAKDHVLVLVIGPVGAPVACLALHVGDVWYSSSVLLEEIFNFVHPDHRRSSHARTLIEAAKAVSDDMRLPLMIGVISNERTEAKVRLYRRLLTPSGAFFLHNGSLARGPDATET